MAREFTDDDRDKTVMTAEGDRIGTVRDVEEGNATVERDTDQGIGDKIRSRLGWGDDDDENQLRSDHVESIGDDEVRLRHPEK